MERPIIPRKEALPLVHGCLTIFALPGELRNEIYRLALDKDFQRVPLNSEYRNAPDPYIGLLQMCSAVYHETRSYMAEKQTAYIPVLADLEWTYGEPSETYGLSRATKDTTVCALTDFMSVHFHLHVHLLCELDYDSAALLDSLKQALKIHKAHSWNLYVQHGLGQRRAVVHLDHLLSLWPKLGVGERYLPIGTLKALVELLAEDKMTDWEIRYYVSTGQANAASSYGHCYSPEAIRDTELAQLRGYARPYDNIRIFAEIYGEDTTWEYGDKTGCVSRIRTPVTEFWPNLHFDGNHAKIVVYNGFKANYPGKSVVIG
jgi:hypothetical protein